MQITIKSKNMEITDRLRAYIEKKVSKLDRYLPNIDEARVELSLQSTKSAGDRQAVQLTLRSDGTILRAEDRSAEIQTSLDAVLDKMTRQIARYKGKHWRSKGRSQRSRESIAQAEPEPEGEVVRVKRFQTRPMDVEEAIEQMELLGHDFFAFYDASAGTFSIVYKRRDGGYGLLQPELT